VRLVIVSNRLPFTVEETAKDLVFKPSAGGVATGLRAFLDTVERGQGPVEEYLWVGWPGLVKREKNIAEVIRRASAEFHSAPVFVDEQLMDSFYNGFCNRTLWPLFHCLPEHADYGAGYWEAYRRVNELFREQMEKLLRSDDIVWIHDYHLMLLPRLVRERQPEASIGFFLHIPFPSREVYQLLPRAWRHDLLEGMLGADLVGFHTNDYTQNFLQCVLRFLGVDHALGMMSVDDRSVKADTFPMGVHFRKFADAARDPRILAACDGLTRTLAPFRLVLSMDRLDYTKGIINRLQGYELFLENNPSWHGKVVLVLIVVPSRIGVDNYQRMKTRIDETVGRINGRYARVGWSPIHYRFTSLEFTDIVAAYRACGIALVTPLRDGMNLIAKEYVAARTDGDGVLILSEMAGSARELGEALIINPNFREEVADALKTALEMPPEEQRARMTAMQRRLERYDVVTWARDFLRQAVRQEQRRRSARQRRLTGGVRREVASSFRAVGRRILFLDYDGTVVPYAATPAAAAPDDQLLGLLERVGGVPGTDAVIISGRDRATLVRWFGRLHWTLVAEHGVWLRDPGDEWHPIKQLSAGWKPDLLPLLRRSEERLPGSFIEEKEFALAWHYRDADPELAALRARELLDDLISFAANADVRVLQGSKVVEVRAGGVTKGTAVERLLTSHAYDGIIAAGDDWTDEDMFRALPETAVTVKVGPGPSVARFVAADYRDVRALLEEVAG